jgi:chromosome segregation ATPase
VKPSKGLYLYRAMLCCAVQVLKEQTRRYKQRLHEAERNAAGLEQQLLAAQSANSKLKSQLQEGDAGQEAEELAQARQQAEGLAKALEVGLGCWWTQQDLTVHHHTSGHCELKVWVKRHAC